MCFSSEDTTGCVTKLHFECSQLRKGCGLFTFEYPARKGTSLHQSPPSLPLYLLSTREKKKKNYVSSPANPPPPKQKKKLLAGNLLSSTW